MAYMIDNIQHINIYYSHIYTHIYTHIYRRIRLCYEPLQTGPKIRPGARGVQARLPQPQEVSR